MMAPTVRHAMPSSSQTVDFDVRVTSHATWSSKPRVKPEFGRAHATHAARTPCFAHNVTDQRRRVALAGSMCLVSFSASGA